MREIEYSYNHPHTDAPAHGRRAGIHLHLSHIALLAVACVLAIGLTFWLISRFPDKAQQILISVDRFGITEAGAKEQQRVYAINHMSNITYEEKQVLIKRTIFFGASREMVYLALGDPVCAWRTKASKQNPATEFWVYYIDNDRKPTLLAFQSNELASASKASALDACH